MMRVSECWSRVSASELERGQLEAITERAGDRSVAGATEGGEEC